jgi:hypothetical protein
LGNFVFCPTKLNSQKNRVKPSKTQLRSWLRQDLKIFIAVGAARACFLRSHWRREQVQSTLNKKQITSLNTGWENPMKTSLTNLRERIAAFDNNEKGMETLQVVLIIAIAAIILALIVNQWETISGWVIKSINDVTDIKGTEDTVEIGE